MGRLVLQFWTQRLLKLYAPYCGFLHLLATVCLLRVNAKFLIFENLSVSLAYKAVQYSVTVLRRRGVTVGRGHTRAPFTV